MDTPRIYVGTYAKYNSGSIAGAWLDLDDYEDKDAFYKACHELHRDESDPELMFQDCEGFPRDWYGESWVDESLWEWLALDENEREIISQYLTVADATDFETILDRFHGQYDSEIDYTYEYIDSCGLLDSMPGELRHYFDYESFSRDLFMDMFRTDAGYVFSSC